MRKQYDVVDTENGEVVEGGFFTQSAAEHCCDEWNDSDSREDGIGESRFIVRTRK